MPNLDMVSCRSVPVNFLHIKTWHLPFNGRENLLARKTLMEITFFIPSLYNNSSLLNVTYYLLGIYWAVLFTFLWRGPGVYEYLLRGVGAAITPGRVHKLAVSVCAPKLKFYVLYCYDKCVSLSLFYRSIPVQINMGDSERKTKHTFWHT